MNFVEQTIKEKGKIVYWHRHRVYDRTLEKALKLGIVLEIDLSYDEDDKKPFIGHPKEYYVDLKKEALPDNISFERVIEFIRDNPETKLVFDCKDYRVFPYLEKLVEQFGSDRFLFSAFVKEWALPFLDKEEVEPHWKREHLPLGLIKEFQEKTDTSWIGTIRGYNLKHLKKNRIVDRVIIDSNDTFISIGIYMRRHGIQIFPRKEIQQIAAAGYLPVFHSEFLLFPPKYPYIAMSEFARRCTQNIRR